MAKKAKGYLNLGLAPVVNLVLAIIPFTSWILGGITRILRGLDGGDNTILIMGILQLIPPITLVFWVIDIITNITNGDLTFYA